MEKRKLRIVQSDAPEKVRQTHQALHHLVADAPWSDEGVLEAVRSYALPAMQTQGAIAAWIIDDTGFLKKGIFRGVAEAQLGERPASAGVA